MGIRAGIYLEITPKINKLIKTVEPYKTGFKKMMRQIRTHHFLYGYVHYDGDRIGDILAEKYTTTESILDLFLRTKLMCFEINNRGDDFRFSRNTNYPITVVRTPKYSLDYEEYKYIFTNGRTWYVGSDYSDIKVNLTKFLQNEIKFAYQLNQSKSLMESFNGFAEDSLNESMTSLKSLNESRKIETWEAILQQKNFITTDRNLFVNDNDDSDDDLRDAIESEIKNLKPINTWREDRINKANWTIIQIYETKTRYIAYVSVLGSFSGYFLQNK